MLYPNLMMNTNKLAEELLRPFFKYHKLHILVMGCTA